MKNWLSVSWFIGLCLLFILTSSGNPITPPSEVSNSSCISYISPAISPNGDGINDKFRVQCICTLEDYSLQIFDASSELVYSSFKLEEAWNGEKDGTPLPQGKYSWQLEYKVQNGDRLNQAGEFILIR
ncbi:MAG: gliding motility-associated C-terminal domain-containing protein [Bacteroidota bacterium]